MITSFRFKPLPESEHVQNDPANEKGALCSLFGHQKLSTDKHVVTLVYQKLTTQRWDWPDEEELNHRYTCCYSGIIRNLVSGLKDRTRFKLLQNTLASLRSKRTRNGHPFKSNNLAEAIFSFQKLIDHLLFHLKPRCTRFICMICRIV